ncbi:hypothetical protein FCV25MIE_16512 [Fagus crenata]
MWSSGKMTWTLAMVKVGPSGRVGGGVVAWGGRGKGGMEEDDLCEGKGRVVVLGFMVDGRMGLGLEDLKRWRVIIMGVEVMREQVEVFGFMGIHGSCASGLLAEQSFARIKLWNKKIMILVTG